MAYRGKVDQAQAMKDLERQNAGNPVHIPGESAKVRANDELSAVDS